MKGKKLNAVIEILEASDLPIAWSLKRRRILKTGDLPWWIHPVDANDKRSNVWTGTDTYHCRNILDEHKLYPGHRLVIHALNLIAKKNPIE